MGLSTKKQRKRCGPAAPRPDKRATDLPRMASGPDSASIALRAIALMAEWRRVTAAHMALGGGLSCACGSAFDGIGVADLEQDLVDYVCDKHAASPMVAAFTHAARAEGRTKGDLAALLRALAQADSPPADALAILQDLERAISGLANSRR